jgi:hypothetical protein
LYTWNVGIAVMPQAWDTACKQQQESHDSYRSQQVRDAKRCSSRAVWPCHRPCALPQHTHSCCAAHI